MRTRLSKPYQMSYAIDEDSFKMPYLTYSKIDYEKSLQLYRQYNWRTRGNFARTMTSKILLLNLDL